MSTTSQPPSQDNKLLGYDEIKDIIVNRFGFKTLDDYKRFLENPDRKPPTKEEIELLSPDRVNSVDFWKVCDDLFGTDPVCNVSVRGMHGYGSPLGIMDANRNNLWIAETLGILMYLREFSYNPFIVDVEIGVGYGSLKNWVETNTKHRYYGFDVVSRVPGIYTLNDRGGFKDDIEQLYGKVNNVIATNVFQHLSEKQRLHYFDTASKLLKDGGLFMFNGMLDPEVSSKHRAEDGNRYAVHYGQFTPHMKGPWLAKELHARGFRLHMFMHRWDDIFGVVAMKNPPDAMRIEEEGKQFFPRYEPAQSLAG
jgi:hypothetical protein